MALTYLEKFSLWHWRVMSPPPPPKRSPIFFLHLEPSHSHSSTEHHLVLLGHLGFKVLFQTQLSMPLSLLLDDLEKVVQERSEEKLVPIASLKLLVVPNLKFLGQHVTAKSICQICEKEYKILRGIRMSFCLNVKNP
jgi:hypothetical protein